MIVKLISLPILGKRSLLNNLKNIAVSLPTSVNQWYLQPWKNCISFISRNTDNNVLFHYKRTSHWMDISKGPESRGTLNFIFCDPQQNSLDLYREPEWSNILWCFLWWSPEEAPLKHELVYSKRGEKKTTGTQLCVQSWFQNHCCLCPDMHVKRSAVCVPARACVSYSMLTALLKLF